MQERKFIIKIYKDYDWEIKLKTLSDYTLYPEFEVYYPNMSRQLFMKIINQKFF